MNRIGQMFEDGMCYTEIAKELGETAKSIAESLIDLGYTPSELYMRKQQNICNILSAALGFNYKEAPKCVNCEIILCESPKRLPFGWSWSISGRVGDLCMGCFKEMNKEHKQRMGRLVDIGCIVCRRELGKYTKPEIHHVREHLGVGQKRNHDETIPLCPRHHRTGGRSIALHAGQKVWESIYGDEMFLLERVNEILDA